MKHNTLRQLRHRSKSLCSDIIHVNSTAEYNTKELRVNEDLRKIQNCDLLLKIIEDPKERELLYLITQSIAETDSIGEAYSYIDEWDTEYQDCRIEAVQENFDGDNFFGDLVNNKVLNWDWYELEYIEPALEIYETIRKQK